MNTLNDRWEYFEKKVLTQEVCVGVREQLKAAFFGGAACMLDFMVNMSGEDVSDDAAAAMMKNLYEEVELYAGASTKTNVNG